MKKVSEKALLVVGLGVAVLALYITGIGCLIKWITGVSCAGCGMTRAVLSALQLDFKEAFYYHPLFWMLPVILIFYLFWEKIPKKIKYGITWIMVIALMGIYIIRLLNPNNTVVTIDIKDGLIAGIFNFFKNLGG